MPAKVFNEYRANHDGTTALRILAIGKPEVSLLVDDHLIPRICQPTWLWDKTLRRCYSYFDGAKHYLGPYVAERAKPGHEARHVRFKNGPYDYRIESLDVKYGHMTTMEGHHVW